MKVIGSVGRPHRSQFGLKNRFLAVSTFCSDLCMLANRVGNVSVPTLPRKKAIQPFPCFPVFQVQPLLSGV
jgi:hypothetical protein